MPSRRNDPKGWSPVNLGAPSSEEKAQRRLPSPWQYILSNEATYPPEVFAHVALQLIFHPERNSKNIRRADILSDSDVNPDAPSCIRETIDGMECTRTIIRRLMPRNPNLDPELEQTCSLYVIEGDSHPTLITYHCHYLKDIGIPYYVPDVLGIAFELCENNIYIAYLPLPEKPNIDDRLQRVALNLLRTIHRHCLGVQEGYKKRVHHDVLVDKASYQDLYISLKNKYAKSLIRDWVEATDPLKHVFEDISLTAFLILLWDQGQGRQTKFVDIGCGNGLLVFLLTMEGYEGYGFDARRRKSWTMFPQHVQDRLHEKILIPYFLACAAGEEVHNGKFEKGTFLISNHADELTSYTPILAALTPESGFLAIPCCEYDFSGSKIDGGLLDTMKKKNEEGILGQGRYGMYCGWICEIANQIGWTVEREMLRIPSTRNFGIVGRRIESQCDVKAAAKVIERIGGRNSHEGFAERARGLKFRAQRAH